MRSRIFGALPLVLSANLVGLTVHSSPQSESSRTALMGYADPLSVQSGQSVRFMVSCDFAEYQADIVRLIHGDINPKGPGFKEKFIHTRVSGEYPGRRQDLRAGSHVTVPDSPALRLSGSLTLQAWIAASTPQKGVQGIVTKWSPADRAGYGLFLDEDGSLALWLYDGRGRLVKVRTGRPLRASIPASSYRRGDKSSGIRMHQMVNQTDWYFVAATFDSETGKVVLYQEPVISWPLEDTRSRTEEETSARSVRSSRADLLLAGYRTEDSVEGVFKDDGRGHEPGGGTPSQSIQRPCTEADPLSFLSFFIPLFSATLSVDIQWGIQRGIDRAFAYTPSGERVVNTQPYCPNPQEIE